MKKSGIFGVVELGLSKLPLLDPFNDVCPLVEVIPTKEMLSLASLRMNRNGRSMT